MYGNGADGLTNCGTSNRTKHLRLKATGRDYRGADRHNCISYMLLGTACMVHGQEDNEQPHPCILTCTSQDHLNYEIKCQNPPRSHSQGIGLHILCRLDYQCACRSRRGPGKAHTLHSELKGSHVQELN